ncbi:MAG: beta/alpha barrel domain-containing protein [Candidatus Saccharimonadales bacterium]
MNSVGYERRLGRIFSPNALIYPLDDVLITGPHDGLKDMPRRYQEARDCEVDAILDYSGRLSDPKYQRALQGVARIMQLSASVSVPEGQDGSQHHLDKVLVSSVSEAVGLDAEAVSFHINFRSPNESKMLSDLGSVVADCSTLSMPLMVHTYVRTLLPDGSEYHFDDLESKEHSQVIAQAVSAVRSLSPNLIIKTPYTGEYFGDVVEAADDVPVVMAGGPKSELVDFLERSIGAMRAGARGIAVGRNIFERSTELPESTDRLRQLNLYRMGARQETISGLDLDNPYDFFDIPNNGVTALLALGAIVHSGADSAFDALMHAHERYRVDPHLSDHRQVYAIG